HGGPRAPGGAVAGEVRPRLPAPRRPRGARRVRGGDRGAPRFRAAQDPARQRARAGGASVTELAGRVALVTGAAGDGIGKATARKLLPLAAPPPPSRSRAPPATL